MRSYLSMLVQQLLISSAFQRRYMFPSRFHLKVKAVGRTSSCFINWPHLVGKLAAHVQDATHIVVSKDADISLDEFDRRQKIVDDEVSHKIISTIYSVFIWREMRKAYSHVQVIRWGSPFSWAWTCLITYQVMLALPVRRYVSVEIWRSASGASPI